MTRNAALKAKVAKVPDDLISVYNPLMIQKIPSYKIPSRGSSTWSMRAVLCALLQLFTISLFSWNKYNAKKSVAVRHRKDHSYAESSKLVFSLTFCRTYSVDLHSIKVPVMFQYSLKSCFFHISNISVARTLPGVVRN